MLSLSMHSLMDVQVVQDKSYSAKMVLRVTAYEVTIFTGQKSLIKTNVI